MASNDEVAKRLVEAYNGGCRQAGDVLYAMYWVELYGLASSYYPATGGREDGLSTVFCAILAGLPTFKGDSSVFTWMYTVANNSLLEEVAKQARDVAVVVQGISGTPEMA